MSSNVCLLRRPLPPSEKYSVAFKSKESDIKQPSNLFKHNEMEAQPIRIKSASNSFHHKSDSEPSQHNEKLIKIHPIYPKGPPPLPPGKILYQGGIPELDSLYHDADEEMMNPHPEFTLNDFLLPSDESSIPRTERISISRQNYLKLTSWFVKQKPCQQAVSSWQADINVTAPERRVPQHQLLLEFQAMLKDMIVEVPAEDSQEEEEDSHHSQLEDFYGLSQPDQNDILIQSSRSRFFCGEGRSRSPFDSSHHTMPLVSPAEMAILQAMLSGGTHLSLKAHFLTHMPDVSHLAHILTHLNLSFNTLKVFPMEILELSSLICLNMRNNPIKDIPSEIRKLTYLRTLSVPFNMLSDLPQGLFDLVNLRTLDVSHNYLQWLSRDIAKLRHLEKLNVECNQLVGLPATLLSLPLRDLRTDGNYFHPSLWEENAKNQPQTLTELCCHTIVDVYQEEPYLHRNIMENNESGLFCDQCDNQIYGSGLRLIRSSGQRHMFGYKCLPLIFQVCSTKCHMILKKCSEIIWNSNCRTVT